METQKQEKRDGQKGQQAKEQKDAKESDTRENFGVTCTTNSSDRMPQHEHVVVHEISSKGHFIVSHLADDESGDRAKGCRATSQADHFKCVH